MRDRLLCPAAAAPRAALGEPLTRRSPCAAASKVPPGEGRLLLRQRRRGENRPARPSWRCVLSSSLCVVAGSAHAFPAGLTSLLCRGRRDRHGGGPHGREAAQVDRPAAFAVRHVGAGRACNHARLSCRAEPPLLLALAATPKPPPNSSPDPARRRPPPSHTQSMPSFHPGEGPASTSSQRSSDGSSRDGPSHASHASSAAGGGSSSFGPEPSMEEDVMAAELIQLYNVSLEDAYEAVLRADGDPKKMHVMCEACNILGLKARWGRRRDPVFASSAAVPRDDLCVAHWSWAGYRELRRGGSARLTRVSPRGSSPLPGGRHLRPARHERVPAAARCRDGVRRGGRPVACWCEGGRDSLFPSCQRLAKKAALLDRRLHSLPGWHRLVEL